MKILVALSFLLVLLIIWGGVHVLPAMGSKPGAQRIEEFKTSAQFDGEKQVFVNRIPDLIEKMRENFDLSTTIEWFKKGVNRAPSKALPELKPDLSEFLLPSDELKVIWFGHSSFILNLSGKIILVDPVFSNSASPISFMVKRFQPPVLKLEELPKIDFIVISHDHYDHLDMNSIKFFRDKSTEFLVPLGVGSHITSWGIEESRITEMDWWQSTIKQGVEFVATPSQHFSGRGLSDANKTLWASWVLRNEAHNVFFSGDTGYDIHFKAIGEKYGPFDVAFIENGQYNEKWRAVHVLPDEAVQAYFDLKAKRFFPVHWGMFVLALHEWNEPVRELFRLSEGKDVKILTPKLGEILKINDDYENQKWWSEI